MRKIDYDSGFKEMIEKNINEVRQNIDAEYMKIKIQNYCTRYDLPYMFVKRRILLDNIFALQFAKDPSKQSYHQHCAADFIKSLPRVQSFKQLPASGGNSLFIVEGILKYKKELLIDTETKSIDFSWHIITENGTKIMFYAAHKHTDQEGGAQDNQYNDLKQFMKHSNKSNDNLSYFLAIGDGPYYQRQPKKESSKTRIELMNDDYSNNHCVALTSNDLESLINKIYLTE